MLSQLLFFVPYYIRWLQKYGNNLESKVFCFVYFDFICIFILNWKMDASLLANRGSSAKP